jgi:tRNA A-37 threonylcarbamoyl transferase component Bud32/ActR/RegA family two-component response regulator
MGKLSAGADRRDSTGSAAAGRATSLCLIVHDDMDLRLRLAALVRRVSPVLGADSVDRSAFAALTIERIGVYVAVLFIIEFSLPTGGADPLANVARLRTQAPRMPILVFARGGDERSAARAMKLGAVDYWPIHSVKIDELGEALKPLVEPARAAVASPKPVERWRQPEIAGYRLLKKIAQSAGATVYLAQNNELAQPIALKVQAIEGLRIGSEADRQRFASECNILSALNHRSIADVLDFGITADYLFLALEYFPCGSLRDRLRHPVSEIDALNYARQIGEALQIVHAAHIVHCDLKPSNVMLTDDNRVVLIDFGSARSQLVASDLSRSDLSTGTPYYVCPEQVAGHDPDARGDLYSLGIVLFEMLAGTLPFEGRTLAEIFAAHRSAEVPRLRKHLTRYQPIVDRLLAKDPAGRYASALAFLEALNAASGVMSGVTAAIRSPAHAPLSKGALDS